MTRVRTFSLASLAAAAHLSAGVGPAHAYVTPPHQNFPSRSRGSFRRRTARPPPPHSGSSSLSLPAMSSAVPNKEAGSRAEQWREELDARAEQVRKIREGLVEKYVSRGQTREYAESEVDTFLSDPDKGKAYVDMRMYKEAHEDMGWETVFTYGAAFSVGVIYQLYMHVNS